MNSVLRVILLLLLGIVLGFAISVVVVDLFIYTTLGSQSFYKTSFDKAGYGIKDVIADSMSAEYPQEIKIELGKDIETLVIKFITYAFGTNDDLSFNIDKEKYKTLLLNSLSQDTQQLGADEIDGVIDSASTQINAQIAELKQKIDPAHKSFKLLLILMWPSLILILLIFGLFFIITKSLRDTFNWFGNFLVWPTLLTLLPLIIARFAIDPSKLNFGEVPTGAVKLGVSIVTSLIDTMLIILGIVFVVGLLLWIVHFFLPKTETTAQQN